MKTSYDVIVIGSGAAGSAAAQSAAARGARVALIERDKLGGTCLNYGLNPTRALLHIARLYHQAQHSQQFGLRIPSVVLDWDAVQAYVQRIITQIRGGSVEEARRQLAQEGIEVIGGDAFFLTPQEVQAAGRKLIADQLIIATGSQIQVPQVEGLRDAGYITNKEAVTLAQLPRRLAVIGGGPVGIELAQMFERFGVEVSMLEQNEVSPGQMDQEMVGLLCEYLSQEGIRILNNVELRRVERTGEGKRLLIRRGVKDEEQLIVDEILLAVGRRPALKGLRLEVAGVETTQKGGIKVDEMLHTSVPHIWAAGDAISGDQSTHVACEQGRLAARNALADIPRAFDYSAIPQIVFCDPMLASVGQSEKQLIEQGAVYEVIHQEFNKSAQAIATDATKGQIKLLVGEQGTLLGAHILSAKAEELLAPIIVAMHAHLPIRELASVILPTLSETMRWAADSA